MSVQRVSILLWKYLLLKDGRVVLLMESTQISPCDFICEGEESWCQQISGWKYRGHFEGPSTKTDILTFLENKSFFARTTYIRLLIYLKAIYRQKMKEIDFFNSSATQWSIFPDRRSHSFFLYWKPLFMGSRRCYNCLFVLAECNILNLFKVASSSKG